MVVKKITTKRTTKKPTPRNRQGDKYFYLKIKIGNDSMQCAQDVGHAVLEASQRLRLGYRDGNIRDINGNVVGSFWFE